MRTNGPPDDFWNAVKLVHSEQLRQWDRFPKYQECQALSYGDYLKGAERIRELEKRFPAIADDWNRLRYLDSDALVTYAEFGVKVGSILSYRTKCVLLPPPPHKNTVATPSRGSVDGGVLYVKAGQHALRVRVTYACPARDFYEREVTSLRARLSELDRDELVAYEMIEIEVPPRLLPGKRFVPLPPPRHPNTVVTPSEGTPSNGGLSVTSGWFSKRVRVTYACPARDLHEQEVASIRTCLSELDRDELVTYETFEVNIDAGYEFGTKHIALWQPPYANTVIEARHGKIEGGTLSVAADLFSKEIYVAYRCPARDLHAQEIELIRARLAGLNGPEGEASRQIGESQFTHPVLFVSHRWESREHPDPRGVQLSKLRQLDRCFVIYDFTSFPQDPLTEPEAVALRLILEHMEVLVRNVIILDSPTYMTRGWCLYEYIVSSLVQSVVCDEVQDRRFVSLRNLKATREWFTFSFRNNVGSPERNYLNEAILATVNEILPTYGTALFTVDGDRAIVDALLLALLRRKLPHKRVYLTGLSEWGYEKWTEEELANAFRQPLTWEPQISLETTPFDMDVPKTINEAVRRRYEIECDEIKCIGLRGLFKPKESRSWR